MSLQLTIPNTKAVVDGLNDGGCWIDGANKMGIDTYRLGYLGFFVFVRVATYSLEDSVY